MRKLGFAKPEPGLIDAERPKDRLCQFIELRRSFYHCQELMKELEQSHDPETVAPIFARAAKRMFIAADEFAEPVEGSGKGA